MVDSSTAPVTTGAAGSVTLVVAVVATTAGVSAELIWKPAPLITVPDVADAGTRTTICATTAAPALSVPIVQPVEPPE